MPDDDAPLPNLRPPLLTRGAKVRLSALALAVSALTAWWWATSVRMPGCSFHGPLAPLDAAGAARRERLRADVVMLATTIGARSTSAPAGLVRAAHHVESSFAAAGYAVTRESYRADAMTCDNLIVERPGSSLHREVVVVGAHYDGVLDKPAANDNASGAAAVLELARAFAGETLPRTVRFVAFTNEEPFHFQTETMGSLVHARRARARGDDVVAMLSLETVGYYDPRPGAQRYPPPLSLFYPDRGDFIAFVGNDAMVGLVRSALGAFRARTRFPSEGVALPERTPGVGWSDHWSFWRAGYPAIMVTDSAPYRDPNYHRHSDTPDKIDFDRMARVVGGLIDVVRHLASTPRAAVRGDGL